MATPPGKFQQEKPMPIGGFVVNVDTHEMDMVISRLNSFKDEVEVYGSDDRGNIVVVISTDTSSQMESITQQIKAIEGVLTVGLTYLHVEDEVKKMINNN